MSEYFTKKADHSTWQLFHKDDRKNPISTIHYAWEKPGLFAQKEKYYRITNQQNVSKKPFQSLESAVAHSVAAHKQGYDPSAHHPIVRVANHINHLGDAIGDASSDHKLEDHHREKLVDVAKAYASLVDIFNKHFGH